MWISNVDQRVKVTILLCHYTLVMELDTIGKPQRRLGASHFCYPHPKSLSQVSQVGRGTLKSLAPLRLFWEFGEKGLGDEG
jgi:hypothetical protein